MARSKWTSGVSAVLAIAALLAPGCASFMDRGVAEEERVAYDAALAPLASKPAEARKRLEDFVRQYPTSPLAADASQRLGEMAEQRGDPDAALRHYYFAARNFPNAPRSSAAQLRIAALENQRGNREAATRALQRVRVNQLSDAERRTAYRLLADTQTVPIARLVWLARLRGVETNADALAGIDVEIDEVLAGLDEVDLTAAADQIEPDVPAARVLLSAAERALDAGDLQRARRRIERASALPLEPAYASRLALATDRLALLEGGGKEVTVPTFADAEAMGLPATRKAQGVLGVVLPLTGDFAPFGEESLRGVLLATGVFDAVLAADERPRVRVVIRDSGGSPQRAAEAVRELARQHGVSAIVGPLLTDECEAAAAAAETEGVPLIALTSRESVARQRAFVFRVLTTPSDEVRALVSYVMGQLGAQRFAILYPRDRYGLGLSGMFWEAVEERGGRVVAVAAYDPQSTDFGDPIRRLVGWELLTPAEKEVIKQRDEMMKAARRLPVEQAALLREEARALLGPDDEPLPPIVDFDALFIPESHENLVLIAPQLAFHEAVGMRLLGTDGWNDPEVVEIGREHVEGALYTASFYADSETRFVRDFAQRFEATFGQRAPDLSAQAYDAANLVLVQLAGGVGTRADVRRGILDTPLFPGASGVLTMSADGNAHKRPFLLEIQRGRVVQVD